MAEPKAWITVKGRRVPIFEGESTEDAIKSRVGNSKEEKKQKAVQLALKQLNFDKPGEYADVTEGHWQRLGISNDRMADLMSKADSKYDYEYQREEEDVKGPMKKVIRHRIYRVPK